MTRKLSRPLFFGLTGSLAVGAAAARSARAAEAYTMRMNLASGITSMLGVAGLRFASAVNRRSNGQLKIDVYPDLQLAREAESVDSLAGGVLDFLIISSPWLVPLAPRFQVFELPFLLKDIDAGYRVIGGPIGQELFADLELRGITGLGWGTGGFRQIETTTKPVVAPEDMKGLRMRIANSAIYIATYQALGAIPITVDQTEMFVALQQRLADGIDVNLDLLTTSKYYTAVKHVAMSNHAFSAQPLLMSKRRLEALPPPLQKIVREEGRALLPFWKSVFSQRLTANVQLLKANGVVFTEVQHAAFRRLMDPIYVTYQPRVGDLLDRVTRVAEGR